MPTMKSLSQRVAHKLRSRWKALKVVFGRDPLYFFDPKNRGAIRYNDDARSLTSTRLA